MSQPGGCSPSGAAGAERGQPERGQPGGGRPHRQRALPERGRQRDEQDEQGVQLRPHVRPAFELPLRAQRGRGGRELDVADQVFLGDFTRPYRERTQIDVHI